MSGMKNSLPIIVLVGVIVLGLVWYFSGSPQPSSITQTLTDLTPGATHPTGSTATTKTTTSSSNPSPSSSGGTSKTDSKSGIATYTSTAYAFNFQYPRSMSLDSNLNAGGLSAQGAVGVVAPYIRIGTVVDKFQVSVSQQPGDLGSCVNDHAGEKDSTINGWIFKTYSTSEIQGSTNVTVTTHRIVHNSKCYELRETLTAPLTNNLPGAEIEAQRANVAAISSLVSTVRNSFRFTN